MALELLRKKSAHCRDHVFRLARLATLNELPGVKIPLAEKVDSPMPNFEPAVVFVKRHSKFIWGFTIAWVIGHWSDLAFLWREVSGWWLVVAAFVVCEVMFNVGLVLMAAAAGRRVFAGAGFRPKLWVKALAGLRGEFGSTLGQVGNSKWFKRGLYLNWFGAAMGTGVLPLVLIPVLLPATSWPLMVTPAVDLFLTFASRMTMRTSRPA